MLLAVLWYLTGLSYTIKVEFSRTKCLYRRKEITSGLLFHPVTTFCRVQNCSIDVDLYSVPILSSDLNTYMLPWGEIIILVIWLYEMF